MGRDSSATLVSTHTAQTPRLHLVCSRYESRIPYTTFGPGVHLHRVSGRPRAVPSSVQGGESTFICEPRVLANISGNLVCGRRVQPWDLPKNRYNTYSEA